MAFLHPCLLVIVACVLPLRLTHAHTDYGPPDLTQQTLDTFIKSAGETPVLLQFYAPWCTHCRKFEPVFQKVWQTLTGQVEVARVDGSAHRLLTMRFRVPGFPSFYLVHGGGVWLFEGPRTHDSLVQFADTRGAAHGKQLQAFAGPFGPYWSAVAVLFHIANRAREHARPFEHRPLVLVAMVISAVIMLLLVFAVILHIASKPRPLVSRPHTE